jgi:hypothetical protein
LAVDKIGHLIEAIGELKHLPPLPPLFQVNIPDIFQTLASYIAVRERQQEIQTASSLWGDDAPDIR